MDFIIMTIKMLRCLALGRNVEESEYILNRFVSILQ